MRTNTAKTWAFLFGLGFWSLLTLGFNGVILHSMFLRMRAEGYPITPGIITHSEVTVNSGEGASYDVGVRYDYRVRGQAYQGTRYRYGRGDSTRNVAQGIVDAIPVGKQVDVFYNSADPSDSVLRTGIEGNDLFMLLFSTPFNVVMLSGWGVAVLMLFPSLVYRWLCHPRSSGRGPRRHLLLVPMPSLILAGASLGFASFVSIFIVVVPFGFNPPVEVTLVAWGCVLAITVSLLVWRPRVSLAGKRLVIDEVKGTLTVTEANRQKEIVVPLHVISAVQATAGRMSEEVVIVYDANAVECRERIIDLEEMDYAKFLAFWLSEQVYQALRNHRQRRSQR